MVAWTKRWEIVEPRGFADEGWEGEVKGAYDMLSTLHSVLIK